MADIQLGSSFCKLKTHTKEVSCCAFSKEFYVTCSGDKSIRVHSATDFKEKSFSPLLAHKFGINCVAFNPSGDLLASASTDGTAHLWEIREDGAKIVCVFRHPDSTTVQVCAFSPNSVMLVTGCSDGVISVWSIQKKKKLFQMIGHPEGNVNAVSFTPCNNFLVTGTMIGDVRVWDLRYNTEFCIMQTEAHDKGISGCGVECICFSPTFHDLGEEGMGEHFLMASCGQDNQIKLWLFKRKIASVAAKNRDCTGKTTRCLVPLHELSGHHGAVSHCCFSPDGKKLASSSFDNTVILWNPVSSKQISVLEGHTAIVTSVQFSTDGHFLATTSYDKTTRIWELADDGKLIPKEPKGQESDAEKGVKTLSQWTTADVINWLEQTMNLKQYSKSFKQNDIDGTELNVLDEDALRVHLGVAALGHRNKIVRGIKELQSQDSLKLAAPNNPSILPTVGNTPISNYPIIDERSNRDIPVDDSEAPDEYLCPISRELMIDPVIAEDGHTYERKHIEAWFRKGGNLSPMTNKKLPTHSLKPNQALKSLILQFIEKHG